MPKMLGDRLPESCCLLFSNMIILCAICSAWLLSQHSKKQSKYRYLVNISGRRQTLSSTHSLQITTQSFQFITAFSALELLDLELSWWSFSIAKCSCQSCFLNSEIMSQASVYVLAFLTSHLCEIESQLTTHQKGELSSSGLLYENAGQTIVTHSAFNVMNSAAIAINITLTDSLTGYPSCSGPIVLVIFLNREVLNLSYFLYTGYFALPLNTF